jgi:lipopolysaccharide assembly outer membrane protein LptD (OstA)
MEKTPERVLLIFICCFLVVSGCARKPSGQQLQQQSSQEMRNFRTEFIGEALKVVLVGESAEKDRNASKASVTKPGLDIATENFRLELTTDAHGTGEVFLNEKTQNVEKVVIEGNITIVQKNPKNLQTNFLATCRKATYFREKQIMVFEGEPEIRQGANRYRADRINYSFSDNRLTFEGNVRVSFEKE